MKCSCIYVDAHDGPEAFRAIDRMARKTHICCECKRDIAANEHYRYESGIWEGTPDSYKTCADCLSVRKAMFCEGYMYNMLWEEVNNYINDSDGAVSTECLMVLTVPARDKVMAMMDEVFREED